MQVWVAVVAPSGRPVDADRLHLLDHGHARWLPFGDHVVRRDAWQSRSKSVVMRSWDNGQDVFECTIARDDRDGALVVGGYVLTEGRLSTHSELLARWSVDGSSHFGGIHSFCHVTPDGVTSGASRSRVDTVFYVESQDLVVISNRPLAAHLVASGSTEPVYDRCYGSQLIGSGLPVGDGAPYVGVRQVPDGWHLEVGPHGCRLVPVADGPEFSDPEAATVDALLDSVAFVADVGTDLDVSLTGGKDSRLVAALLANKGVAFRASTHGLPDHPDVIVAARVARHLGVSHRVTEPRGRPELVTVDIGERLHRIVRGSDGMLAAFDAPIAMTPGRAGRGVGVGGAGGEILRAGLARDARLDEDRLQRQLRWQFMQNERLLTPFARAERVSALEVWNENRPTGLPAEALAHFHQDIRLGRWNMAARLAQIGKGVVQPMLDSRVVRASRRVDLERRLTERAFHSILRQVDPVLASMPLADNNWRFERAQITDSGSTDRPFAWRTALQGELGEALIEVVYDSPARAEIFEIVDADAFDGFCRRVRAGEHDGKDRPARFLWAAATIGMLWAGGWQSGPSFERVVSIPVPSR